MKGLILKLLALFGLAPAGHVTQAHARAQRGAEKAQRLEGQLSKLRADRDVWKQRHQEVAAAAAAAKKAVVTAEEAARRAQSETERVRAQVDEWRTRAEGLSVQLRELRERLEESRRVGTLAREHLMATETKLDLIEAAIQVLDARTREAAVSQS
jgi:chromosome segregation ATPase